MGANMIGNQSQGTAGSLAGMLERGETTSEALARQCFEGIRQFGDDAIFITLTEQSALSAARLSDKRRANGQTLGPWDGIPVAWKDLVDIPNTPTTAGSAIRRNAPAPEQAATIYQACEAQGLICIGKTNLSEFAYSGLGLNPHFGTPVNPASTDVPLAPGGSSSGSAVAVAASIVPVSIGTDTAGSVRVPAAFCGAYGFKSSQTRYDKTGIFPLSSSLDSVGIFARDMDDIIAMDAILRSEVQAKIVARDVSEIEAIIPDSFVISGLSQEVSDSFEQAIKLLQNNGVSVRRQPFSIFDEVAELFAKHGTLTVAEAATFHAETLKGPNAALMDQRVRERMLTASSFTAQDYILLQSERLRLERAVAEHLDGRFMLFPTVATTAPPIQELDEDDAHFARTNLLALRNTMVGNYLGMPGVSIPVKNQIGNAPVGLLFSAANGYDANVLSAGRMLQDIFSADG